jgi:hypothetical protein
MSDSEISSEIEEGYPIESSVPSIPTHLPADKLEGVRNITLHVALPEGSTLESLQKNYKDGYYWAPPAHVLDKLRHITSMQNRANPSEKDYEGSIRKMLIVGAEVMTENRDTPKEIAIDIPGLVPEYATDTGLHNWVIDKGHGTLSIGQSIFNPDNMFTEEMYNQLAKCDLKALKNHINLGADSNKQFALMETQGVGWKVMTSNWSNFSDFHEAVVKHNPQMFDGSVQNVSFMAKVPYALAEELHNAISEPIKNIEKSLVDFSKFRIKLSPANGQAWNHDEGLIRETMGLDAESKEYERTTESHRPISASVRLNLKYTLMDE